MTKAASNLFYSLSVSSMSQESLKKELLSLGLTPIGTSTVYSGDAATSEYRVHVFITEENLSYLILKMPGMSARKLFGN